MPAIAIDYKPPKLSFFVTENIYDNFHLEKLHVECDISVYKCS